jgi:UMF1 family MFS transporter
MPSRSTRLLANLGFRTKAQGAWALYDWANSAMITIVVTAIYPVFFASFAAAGLPGEAASLRHSVATTAALALVALVAPLLGAYADRRPVKKQLLGAFLALGAAAVGAMFFIRQGQWLFAALLFALANIGANGSFVLYDALLPHVAGRDEIDRVSAAGYALGYFGGGLALAAALALISRPEWFGLASGVGLSPAESSLPVRLVLLAVALWWVIFSIPLFRHVTEPPIAVAASAGTAAAGASHGRRERFATWLPQLRGTLRALRRHPQALRMLIAFLIYNDGIGTVIRMAAIYAQERGIPSGAIIGSILVVQFVGIPFAFLCGALAQRIGARPVILVGLVVYSGISVLGYFMQSATHFFILAFLVGMVQGGTQALSRSLYGSMIPAAASGEFFGLFAVFEKFAGIAGPALFALMIWLTGSSREAILSILLFFVVGGWLLARVDVAAGRAAVASS